jgi:hypothetical protein
VHPAKLTPIARVQLQLVSSASSCNDFSLPAFFSANRLQVTNEMLQQLTGIREDGTMRRSAAAAGDIVFGDLNSTTPQDR